MDINLLILVVCFFLIAIIYSSVGFGGGSSYLALLAVMGVHFEIIRPAALLCNIIVVSGGTYIFWKTGALDWKKSWPFLITSVPLAFIGGLWKVENVTFFFVLLGTSLIIASVLLWIRPASQQGYRFHHPVLSALMGGALGFLSGLVGIGGGIFLSPLLHLLHWGDAKKITALASLFILLNSISGVAGQITHGHLIHWQFITPLLLAVFIGGQIGSRLGARKFDSGIIRRTTALLILVAGIKILRDHL